LFDTIQLFSYQNEYCLNIQNVFFSFILNTIFVSSKQKQSTNKMENSQTQLEKVNVALMALYPNITTSDRREAPYSEFTVVQYLKGRGKDLETAMSLLQFFTKRIDGREKQIARVTEQ
jgi:hypothetical protein